MSEENENRTPQEDLSEELIQQIDALDDQELKSLLAYINRRVESHSTPTVAEIQEDATGEVLDVETHGGYAQVRMHPPDPDGPGENTEVISSYHVRREPKLDGTDSLHWTYLEDKENAAEIRCKSCGRAFDHEREVCPNCGSEDINRERKE